MSLKKICALVLHTRAGRNINSVFVFKYHSIKTGNAFAFTLRECLY